MFEHSKFTIKKLGNVRLINPFDEQFKYIKNSDLVITDNGTSGWEALILKKPLINLSDSFYDILSNYKVNRLSKLGETMINILLNKGSVRKKFLPYFTALHGCKI